MKIPCTSFHVLIGIDKYADIREIRMNCSYPTYQEKKYIYFFQNLWILLLALNVLNGK